MDKFRKSIFFTCLLISIPSLLLFGIGVVGLNFALAAIWSGVMFLWWGAYYHLRSSTKRAVWLVLCLVNLFWWPLLWRNWIRIVFVIENGGMERADGYGSPAAFFFGLVHEQLFFLPLSFSLIYGIVAILTLNKSVTSAV